MALHRVHHTVADYNNQNAILGGLFNFRFQTPPPTKMAALRYRENFKDQQCCFNYLMMSLV